MKLQKILMMLAALFLALSLTAALAEESADAAVGDWYLNGVTMDGSYVTVEQLGTFMHISLREDGTAANIAQDGTETPGTWRREEDKVVVSFSGSDAVFAEQGGRLITALSDGSMMCYGREVAGIYTPGNMLKAESAADFNGTWCVKWILSGGKYQSVEYLSYMFGLENMTLQMEDGTLHAEDADYGMVFSEGMLYFGMEGSVVMLIGLQDDGMLYYGDAKNDIAYFCEKVQ